MSFPLFFRGLFGVLVVFAATTYCVKQSVWATTIQTLMVAVLLQVGYFIGVLMIVWRSGTKAQPEVSNGDMQASPVQGDDSILSIHDGSTGWVARIKTMPEAVALIDCNFYRCCERVFDPTLIGVPVVVLSNNDGCEIRGASKAGFNGRCVNRHHGVTPPTTESSMTYRADRRGDPAPIDIGEQLGP